MRFEPIKLSGAFIVETEPHEDSRAPLRGRFAHVNFRSRDWPRFLFNRAFHSIASAALCVDFTSNCPRRAKSNWCDALRGRFTT